jgi:adenylyltransferase/sulfurtransferase
MNRYHRQILLPSIGLAGQSKLAAARVLLVGCGALGSNLAEQLIRAGVGFVRLVDRDLVELTNLQRQVLFDESHAAKAWPKAAAAAERLSAVNSEVTIEPVIADLHAGNVAAFIGGGIDLILDGTDNVATRYLLNDVAVKEKIPWIYGACVGMEGRMMVIRPGSTACLRCLFPAPPKPGDLPTCDTAGVLGPAAALIASLQTVAAIKLLTGNAAALSDELLSIDLWSNRARRISLAAARSPDCPCCGLLKFEFLDRPPSESAISLCGRDAIQIRGGHPVHLPDFAARWQPLGALEQTRYFLRCALEDPPGVRLTLFADGRLIVQGARDAARAKSLHARFVGS